MTDLSSLAERVSSLEVWKAATDIANARREEQWNTMVRRLDNIDNNIKWVIRIIISAVLVALMALILNGGIHIQAPT